MGQTLSNEVGNVIGQTGFKTRGSDATPKETLEFIFEQD